MIDSLLHFCAFVKLVIILCICSTIVHDLANLQLDNECEKRHIVHYFVQPVVEFQAEGYLNSHLKLHR